MNARRIAAPEAQNVNSAGSLQDQTILGLYPELVRGLPVGVVLLLLEDPSDVKTFRIVDTNRAAAEITGSTTQKLLGKTFADFAPLCNGIDGEGLSSAVELYERYRYSLSKQMAA